MGTYHIHCCIYAVRQDGQGGGLWVTIRRRDRVHLISHLQGAGLVFHVVFYGGGGGGDQGPYATMHVHQDTISKTIVKRQ